MFVRAHKQTWTLLIKSVNWYILLLLDHRNRLRIDLRTVVYIYVKAVGTFLGLGGGGAKKILRGLIILFFKRIQFCSLVYLWFPISTELLTYFSHISIHWSICRCFYNLENFGLAKYWGGGGNCPPPAPLFLRPCTFTVLCETLIWSNTCFTSTSTHTILCETVPWFVSQTRARFKTNLTTKCRRSSVY